MTPADLRAWIKTRGLSHEAAARLLALPLDGLRKRLYGATDVGAQTAQLTKYIDQLFFRAPQKSVDV